MNGLRERLYPKGFRPMRFGPPLFAEANLDPHYWPYRGIVWSIVVHSSLLSALVILPMIVPEEERPRFEDAIILDADDLKNALYLPLLGGPKPPKTETKRKEEAKPEPAKEGLSYPGPQPIVSHFPVPTNHTQTILQPALKNPVQLNAPPPLPNIVRLPPPAVDRKLAVSEPANSALRPPPLLAAPRDVALTTPTQALVAPRADSKLNVPEQRTTPSARPSTAVAQFDPTLSVPARALTAPAVNSRLTVPEQTTTPAARASATGPVAQLDPTLTGPSKALTAPLAETRFKLPEQVTTTIARPSVTVPVGEPTVGLSGPTRALTAPREEAKFSVPGAVSSPGQPTRSTQVAPLDVAMTGPARALTAPREESKINVPAAASAPGQPARTTQVAPLDVQMAGPSRALTAPVAESTLKIPNSLAAPVAQPTSAAVAPRLDVPMAGPSRALTAPAAESKLKVPEATTAPVARPTTVAAPVDTPLSNAPPIVALSPTPGRRDQPVVVPPGEARGEFVISPQPNLTFPGTEPGVRGGSSTTTTTSNSGIVTLNSTTASSNARTGNNTTTTSGTGRDAFPGITILGGDSNSSAASRNSNSTTVGTAKTPPAPLQTSYNISILASGGTGGGLPDVGVFSNEQVHTVYLDMRETIDDEPVSWTVAFGVKQPDATSDNERVTNVGGQQETVLPFPIEKTRPVIPADLVRRYSGRLVLAYAMVNTEGKMEQLSIKQSPDPALNELVLSALKKWSFRPARRNGEVIPAKILLGVIVRTY